MKVGQKASMREPACFTSEELHEGNFLVHARVSIEQNDALILIYAGRRQLKYIGLQHEKEKIYSFIVNLSDYINRGELDITSDYRLSIQLHGDARLEEVDIQEASCPTIFIGGDSTVTEQTADMPYYPCNCYCGWGQMISAYLDDKIAICNQAHSGLTSETFRSEGHYGITEKMIKKDDFMMLQFAHNDQKLAHLKAGEGYRENIIRFIDEIRAKEAKPILVTPLARNSWLGNGEYNDLLCEYANVIIDIGKEKNVPVIDLHKRSMELIIENGLESSKKYFYPGDYTHTNDYGGYLIAGIVAEELKKAVNELAGYVCDANYTWDAPAVHELPENHDDTVFDMLTEQFKKWRDEGIDRPNDILTRAEAADMVTKRFNFFQSNVYNDLFDDIVGHEWYAGSVESAVQNGVLTKEMLETKNFRPDEAVSGKDFSDITLNAAKSRYKDIKLPILTEEKLTREKALRYLLKLEEYQN